MDWSRIKELIIKTRYIWGGLLVAYIPHDLEQISLVLNLDKYAFLSGLVNGLSVGMKIVGLCIFAYGIAHFDKKTAEVLE